MATSSLNQFWVEFIELYKSLPELWRKDTDEYTNKNLRTRAYDVMVDKYKEVDKEANIYTVKKKINNLRTCFRREVNKIRRSEQSALSPNDVYAPTLWYFPLLEFLIDEEEELSGGTTMMEAMEEVSIVDEEYTPPQPKKKKISTQVVEEQPLPYVKSDKAKTLSASWEVLYRDLEPRQKLFANRMINEVLYQGALGQLHESSYKILEMAVEDTNGEDSYSPGTVEESKYFVTESSDHADEQHITHKKKRERNRPMKYAK